MRAVAGADAAKAATSRFTLPTSMSTVPFA
jgi:hypothetical protein